MPRVCTLVLFHQWFLIFIDGPVSGEVRLYYRYSSPSYYHGLVEVYNTMSEEWGTVAGSWTLQNADVVCSQLGFELPCKIIKNV